MKQVLQILAGLAGAERANGTFTFEASEDFTHDRRQASDVIAASDRTAFYSFPRAGSDVVRVLVVDPAEDIHGLRHPDDLQRRSQSTS